MSSLNCIIEEIILSNKNTISEHILIFRHNQNSENKAMISLRRNTGHEMSAIVKKVKIYIEATIDKKKIIKFTCTKTLINK